MKKLNKKAFTIVELVIVIAVIAILAAILIPTFTNVVENARQSNDTQVVRQLNNAVAIESAYNQGKKPATMHEAVQIADAYGYRVGQIVAKSQLSIAWDNHNKRFVLLDESQGDYGKFVFPINETSNDEGLIAEKDTINYFVVRQSVPTEGRSALYSIYASPEWKGGDSITVSVGFDAGDQTFKSITYNHNDSNNFLTVGIRTNSYETALIVNAPHDTINHYDIAGSVNVIESAMASYHEYGKVPFLEVSKGRIALEEGAEVEKLHFNTKTESLNDTQDEVLTKSTIAFDDIIVAAAEGVTLPEFSRDTVEIQENGNLVVELQKDTNNNEQTEKDYIWLYKQGVISQIVVVDEKIEGIEAKVETDGEGNTNTKFVATDNEEKVVALGVSEKAAETQKAAVEIANNYAGNNTSGSITVGETEVELPKLDKNGDLEVVAGVATADIAEKLGEGKTVEDVISASKEDIATAVASVDANKKSEELQGKTAEQIKEEVKEVTVAEGGKDKEAIKEEATFDKVLNFVSTIDTLGCGETYKFETTLDSKDIVWDWECIYDVADGTEFDNGSLTSYYYNCTYTIKATLGSRTISHDVTITPYHAGTGTEDDHIEIINYTQYSNLLRGNRRLASDYSCYIYSIGKYDSNFDPTGEKTYIDFVDDIDFNWTNPLCDSYYGSNKLYCYNLVIDGKGHTIDYAYGALFSPYCEHLAYRFGDFTVKNLTLDNFVGTYYGNAFGYGGSKGGTITLEGINVNFSPEYYSKDSDSRVSYYGSMLGWTSNNPIVFRNCNVTNANVNGNSGWDGGFVGNGENVTIENCSFSGSVTAPTGNAAGFIGQGGSSVEIKNSQIMPGSIIKNQAAGGSVQAFGTTKTNGLVNNSFYGSLVCDTESKATQAPGCWSKSDPALPANSFVIDENRNITYVGTEQISKVKVTYSYAIDRLMTTVNPVRFDGYMPTTIYSEEFENVTSNSQFVTIQEITNIVNVVDTEYVSKVFNATDDTSHLVAENRLGETEFYLEGTTIYVDGRGSCPAFFSGSASYSKDTGELTAKNMTSNFASITVYAYDANGELLGTNVLRYGFEIK